MFRGFISLQSKLAKKSDADSFDVLTTLLAEHLRRLAYQQALADTKAGYLDRKIQLWDKVRATLALADTGSLDRKVAFINAITDIKASL